MTDLILRQHFFAHVRQNFVDRPKINGFHYKYFRCIHHSQLNAALSIEVIVSLTQLPNGEKAKQSGVIATFNFKFPTNEDLSIIGFDCRGYDKTEIDSVFPLSDANK